MSLKSINIAAKPQTFPYCQCGQKCTKSKAHSQVTQIWGKGTGIVTSIQFPSSENCMNKGKILGNNIHKWLILK